MLNTTMFEEVSSEFSAQTPIFVLGGIVRKVPVPKDFSHKSRRTSTKSFKGSDHSQDTIPTDSFSERAPTFYTEVTSAYQQKLIIHNEPEAPIEVPTATMTFGTDTQTFDSFTEHVSDDNRTLMTDGRNQARMGDVITISMEFDATTTTEHPTSLMSGIRDVTKQREIIYCRVF